MKVFISSYNVVCQNASGGVQVRIKNYLNSLNNKTEIKLFNMWTDSIDDCDILHVFKANIDVYSLMIQAKAKKKKVVLSSVIPQEKAFNIKHNLVWSKIFHLQTGYSIIKNELDLADFIVAQTQKEKDFIKKQYKIRENKISVIPNGVGIVFCEDNRNAINRIVNISKPYLLQVGRFDENKNQLSVIRALRESDIEVLFVGGPDPQYLSYFDQCRQEANDRMHFVGWLDSGSPEMQSAYMNAKAVILPSHKEIFGNSLIEGGAAGANLIATCSLPLKSMEIDQYCDIINPNSIDDIRKKINIAMKREKNEGQVNYFLSKFSWDSVAKQYQNIYERCIKGSG